jgi:hypothetical protein
VGFAKRVNHAILKTIMQFKKRFLTLPNLPRLLSQLVLIGGLSGCSMDFVPVHYSRVNAIQIARQPVQRGPAAPGAFHRSWTFKGPAGFLMDASRVDVVQGSAKLREPKLREAVIETETGFPYIALDSFHDSSTGLVRYQISHNGSKWYWHNGTAWVEAERNSSQTNAANIVNAHISTFHSEVASGVLQLKIFLLAPSAQEAAEVREIQVEGISPHSDGWH